jgi:hypothetical protein
MGHFYPPGAPLNPDPIRIWIYNTGKMVYIYLHVNLEQRVIFSKRCSLPEKLVNLEDNQLLFAPKSWIKIKHYESTFLV